MLPASLSRAEGPRLNFDQHGRIVQLTPLYRLQLGIEDSGSHEKLQDVVNRSCPPLFKSFYRNI